MNRDGRDNGELSQKDSRRCSICQKRVRPRAGLWYLQRGREKFAHATCYRKD